jgi:5-methylcytosine-specific restriction endonuclease McrA
MPLDPRSGRPRLRACAAVRARHQPCHLCGQPIDQTLPRNHRYPLSSSVDELTPIAYGGDPLDPANLAESHRVCNLSRGTKPITPEVRARCRELYDLHTRARRRTLSAAW